MDASPSLLLVEPHADTCQIVGRVVRRWGWEVLPAADGRTAIRLAAGRHVDVAVVDAALPDVQFADFVRRLKSVCAVPLIVTTTALAPERERYRPLRFHEVLLKPYGLEPLYNALASAIRTGDACTCV